MEPEGPLRWYVVAQLAQALPYKPEGLGFDSRWGHCDFSLGSTHPLREMCTRDIAGV